MTPDDLFKYAASYAGESEAAGRGTQYPTVREAARHFRVTQVEISDQCDDWQGDGYMKLATGIRVGSSVGSFENLGDCLVEAYT